MNRLIKFILGIVICIILGLLSVIVIPNISRTCSLKEFGISLKIPYAYAENSEANEEDLLDLYNNRKGIQISATEVNSDFWSSGDLQSRMDEYLEVVSAVNYEASISNPNTYIYDTFEGKIGKVDVELSKTNSNSKVIAIITNDEIGNLVIEFIGSIEDINNNIEEIEKIISTIKIREN